MNNNVSLYGVLVSFRNCLFVQSLLAGYLVHCNIHLFICGS